MIEYLSVGLILKPQGLKGEIKVKPLTDDPERFSALTTVFLKTGDRYRALKLAGHRYDKNFVYLKIEGLNSIEEVEYLRNQFMWIPRTMARVLPKDTFFIADIIGCRVVTNTGNDLGEIIDIIQTGSNDVYVVKGDRGEVLIPALKQIVKGIHPELLRVDIDLSKMEGLLDDED